MLDLRRKIILLGGKMRFSLRDDFTDTLAAGSVNGTAATPGPGTRNVTDTTNLISIGSGYGIIAPGAIGGGDPGFTIGGAITRAAGKILIGKIMTSNAVSSGRFGFGFSASVPSTTLVDGMASINAGAGTTGGINTENIGSGAGVGTYTQAVWFQFAVVLRATGAYYFLKTGTYWYLAWVKTAGATTPVYVNLFASTAGAGGATKNFDMIRIPQSLFPTMAVDAYDTFTRANGALGATETTGPDAQAVTARTYLGGATWAVATNKAVCTPATLGADLVVNGAFAADTDWDKGAGWSIGAGVATKVAGAATNLTQTVAPLTVGKWYTITYTITRTAGTLNSLIGAFIGPNRAANGTYTDVMRADTTAFGFAADAAFAGTVDNVTAQELTVTELISAIQVSNANIYASINLTITAGIKCGLVIRLDDEANPQNFIVIGYDGSKLRMGKCVAGTYTNLINVAATYSAGKDLVVTADGSSIRCMYNGANVGATQTVSDAGILTNTKHAPLGSGAGAQLNDFLILAFGTENQYIILDKYAVGG